MTPKDIVKYWQDTAQDDLETADALFQAKKYSQALFFCHLAIEKQLKGLVYAKTNEPPLLIHDLPKLAKNALLTPTESMNRKLEEISRFNIDARYDSYKRLFYKKATKKYSTQWLQTTKEVFLWLKSQY